MDPTSDCGKSQVDFSTAWPFHGTALHSLTCRAPVSSCPLPTHPPSTAPASSFQLMAPSLLSLPWTVESGGRELPSPDLPTNHHRIPSSCLLLPMENWSGSWVRPVPGVVIRPRPAPLVTDLAAFSMIPSISCTDSFSLYMAHSHQHISTWEIPAMFKQNQTSHP